MIRILKITSNDALNSAVADVVRLKIKRTRLVADMDQQIAEVQKTHQSFLEPVEAAIAEGEARIQEYCIAHRRELFPEKKSRDLPMAEFGFELTPPRVETSSRKITWKDVVARLLRLPWGSAYLQRPEPKPDKNALLADREKLTEEQCVAAGIRFAQEEQFFIRPKPESAELGKG